MFPKYERESHSPDAVGHLWGNCAHSPASAMSHTQALTYLGTHATTVDIPLARTESHHQLGGKSQCPRAERGGGGAGPNRGARGPVCPSLFTALICTSHDAAPRVNMGAPSSDVDGAELKQAQKLTSWGAGTGNGNRRNLSVACRDESGRGAARAESGPS